MDSLQKTFLYLLIFLNIAVPITTIIVSQKLSKGEVSQMFPVYPPGGGGGGDDDDDDPPASSSPNNSASPSPSISPSPSTSPSGITIKAVFQGLPVNSQNISFTLVTNNWSKTVIMNADGTFSNFDFSGLDKTKSYDFVLYAHPYLTSKKSINLATGAQTVDFGTIRTGDLDGNNQVNTLDWSFMKLNFGVDGDQ